MSRANGYLRVVASLRRNPPSIVVVVALVGCASVESVIEQAKHGVQPYLGGSASGSASAAPEAPRRITVNGKAPSATELARLERTYARKLPTGDYWHDSRSGLAGRVGGHAEAHVPGYDFGPVPRDASRGHSGILFNGRELNDLEASMVGALFGVGPAELAAHRGAYRLDSQGNLFRERDGSLVGNLVELAQKRGKASSKGGDGFWSSRSGAAGNSEGGCSYVSIPSSSGSGSTSVSVGC